MGLGGYPEVSLAAARQKAAGYREAIEAGRDPFVERGETTEPTFGECADEYIASKEAGWRNEKHRKQWRMTLGEYCKSIRAVKVSEVNTPAVIGVLNPIWNKKPETAKRLRGRIENVLNFAKANGWRTGENPAQWRGHLENLLPPPRKLSRGHHSAMPYAQTPAFVTRLQGSEAIAARALEFLILNASRSGEVLNAVWPEVDFGSRVWSVPAHRMKGGQEHQVPLSEQALSILQPLHDLRVSDFVFYGQRLGRPLSASSMTMLMRRMKTDQWTIHGFRSSFRDWCGNVTEFDRELAEHALAHSVGNKVELAYRRERALERRRVLMQAWADYCCGGQNP